MNPPNIPTFETWTHENLAKFAHDAYLKLQTQHDLIQYLQMLVAATPKPEFEHPEEVWKRAVSEMHRYLDSAYQSGIDDWYLTLNEELIMMEDAYVEKTRTPPVV